MSNLTKIKEQLSSYESLERELNLKQLQINRLLNITQAINHNVSADGLFEMYQSFLKFELGIKRMCLFVKKGERWLCTAFIGIKEELLKLDISRELERYDHLKNIDSSDHPLIKQFDVVIPVRHKDNPIAYVFIGGMNEQEDMYGKIQFITTITNIIAVAIENKRLFKRQLEQERLKREMELASEMQRMLIPGRLPAKACYEFDSIYKPQLGVGGDYFDFIEFDDDKIVFCIGDISGKGMAAALLMANFQANFHTLINKRTGLIEFIHDLNASVNRITLGDKFLTFFIAEYDISEHRLRYINAGHNPPVFVSGGQLQLLKKGCTILGSFVQLPEVEVGQIILEEDAIVLAYTDGLIDLKNRNGDFFSEESLNEFVLDHSHLSSKEFNGKLMELIEKFKGEQTYTDDFTILTCKLLPAKRPQASLKADKSAQELHGA